MDEKISLAAIAQYADTYAERVTKAWFVDKDRITGSEILSFSGIQQVNLFIINELFKTWKEETKKVKSPYFDYDHPDVVEALDNLMNILSRNIVVTQAHFLPLVKKAVNQTLLITFTPYDYYAILLTGKNDMIDVAAFREEIKYLRINKGPLNRMLEKLNERGLEQLTGNEALGLLDEVLEEVNFTPEEVDPYIEKFSVVAPLDPSSFFVSSEPPQVTQPPIVQKVEPVIERTPEPKPVINPPKPSNQNQVISSSVRENVVRENVPKARPSIAENFQRIKKIKESLTINQKFMFTKVLFHGDFELFSRAIDRLDQFDNLPSAMRYIEDEHASTWDRDSEEFHEFMELVEKRFV